MKRRKKETREGLVEIGDLIAGALKALGAKSDYELFQVGKHCREILGEAASRALVDVGYEKGRVELKFNHSIWLQEMNFRKAELLGRLQQDLPGLGIQS
ncbi:MAG TPA: DciA family protein, partial [bacterium]|nr:DciA family protein [bacterium]